MSNDEIFLMVTPAAVQLVDAVRAGDEVTIRDLMLDFTDRGLWAMVLALAAMAGKPDPEDVLKYCCSVETRLTHSQHPHRWSPQDLQDALCVARARTEPPGTVWVERGAAEWRRRRDALQANLDEANATALEARSEQAAS